MDSSVDMPETPCPVNDDPHALTRSTPTIRSISPLTRDPLEQNERNSDSIDVSYSSIESSLNGSPRNYTEDNAFGDGEDDERQPLLVVRSSEPVDEIAKDYVSYKNNKAFVYTLLVLLGLTFFFYLTFQQLDSLVVQAIDTDFQSISVMELNNDGINCHVVGFVSMHYGNINNYFYRFFMKFASVIIGSVIIIPNDAVKLYATSQGRNESLHVLNIYPPNVQVDIANDALTEIDFISKTELMKENIAELINNLENTNDEEIVVKLTGVLDSTIESKFFQYSTKNTRFHIDYNLNKTDLVPTIMLENLTVQQNLENNTEIEFYSTIRIDNNFPIKANLASIDWDVSIEDCNKELVKLGEWRSYSLSIQPDSPLIFDISGRLLEIPDNLLQCCNNNITIINKLVQDYLLDKPTIINVNASYDENNKENLPKWLLFVLNKAKCKVQVSLPSPQGDISDSIQSYDIDSLFLEVLLSTSPGKLNTITSSNVSMVSTFPGIFSIEFAVPRFQNSVLLRQYSKRLMKGWSNADNAIVLHRFDDDNFLQWNIGVDNFESDALEPALLGELASRLLSGHDILDSIYVDMVLDAVEVSMPILNTTLKHLVLPSVQLNIKSESINSLPEIIDRLNVTINSITYVGSTKEELILMADSTLLNPTKISLDVPDDTISFVLKHNDTIIGNVSTSDLLIPQTGDFFDFTFTFRLNATTTHGKLLLEYLIGEFISGYEDLTLSVYGTTASASRNKGLADFLGRIAVEDIRVPNISFSHHRLQNLPQIADHHRQHQSPFLIDATIHIFSSELEFTVFNPLDNAEIVVEIFEAQASHNDAKLGHVQPDQHLIILPGIYKTPRIPFAMDAGIGMDILRKALNGSLRVQVLAIFKANIGEFDLLLLYEGSNLSAAIRW